MHAIQSRIQFYWFDYHITNRFVCVVDSLVVSTRVDMPQPDASNGKIILFMVFHILRVYVIFETM